MENTLENAALAALSSAAVMASFTVGATDASATTEVPRGPQILRMAQEAPDPAMRGPIQPTRLSSRHLHTSKDSPGS
ncbi:MULTISPECIES: hypothetical protein [unclassified Streptomyces]|uniref:hypothetical protein n=1 Tax=unclassified Streptomyces TaxID=2593676 RepID=UPI0004BDABD2|nr:MULTISPECIES: hypothetical protein [unclassified Streptomyces]